MKRAAPYQSLRIRGAVFTTAIDMRDTVLTHALEISGSRFADQVVLYGLRTPNSVRLNRSEFQDTIWLVGSRIGGDLLIQDAQLSDIVARGSRIDGGLSLRGSRVTGGVDFDGTTVEGSVFFKAGDFQGIDLKSATIGQAVNARSARVRGKFDAAGLQTGGSVLMDEGATFAEVDLLGAKIRGQLSLYEASIDGRLRGESLSVGQGVTMADGRFNGEVELDQSTIVGGLDVSGATLSGLELSYATITTELSLDTGGKTVRWVAHVNEQGVKLPALLALRGTSVGGLVDSRESWPENLQYLLRDFTYKRLWPLPEREWERGMIRKADWYASWLARETSGSLQPYRQLARVLASHGGDENARSVLIAGRERQRQALPWWSPERWLLWALRWTIGYGYGAGEMNALYWALSLLIIGTTVAKRQGARLPGGDRPGFWYSLDMLIPGLRLSALHDQLELSHYPRYYFHLHRFAGYTLMLFVIAGLTGITDPGGP